MVLDEQATLILFACLNILLNLGFRIINELISSNYSFVYSYPLKKMPCLFNTGLVAILLVLFIFFEFNI